MYEITAISPSRLLKIRLTGFWTGETFDAYQAMVVAQLTHLRRTVGCRAILIDMLDYPIQSASVASAHAENLRAVQRSGDTRVALLLQSALSKLQAARIAADTGHQTFTTEAEAMAWIQS